MLKSWRKLRHQVRVTIISASAATLVLGVVLYAMSVVLATQSLNVAKHDLTLNAGPGPVRRDFSLAEVLDRIHRSRQREIDFQSGIVPPPRPDGQGGSAGRVGPDRSPGSKGGPPDHQISGLQSGHTHANNQGPRRSTGSQTVQHAANGLATTSSPTPTSPAGVQSTRDAGAAQRREPSHVASALYTASGELIPDSWLGRETNVDPKSADGKWIQTYLDGRPIVWPAHLAGATFPNTILVAAPVLSVNGQFQRLTIYDAWDRYADIRRTNVALLELFPFLVLLLAAATYFAVGISFKPLNKLLAQAHQLGFDDRLATADKAEFGQLAASINQYLDRIQEVVKQQEEFAVDAAHELCTPLTALRGELELAMMQRRDSAGYEEAAKNAVAQVARLQRLVEGLLLATRPREASVTKCDVEQILEEVQARWVDRYAAHHVNLELSAEAFKASMPEEELESVLENLLSNALKFSPPGSTVRIALDVKGGLVVEDQGPGIPESDRDRIFERFERGTTKARGFGVGLYLVRRLLEQRGGSVKIGDSKIGTRVEVALPA